MKSHPSESATSAASGRTEPPFIRRVRIRGYKSIAFCDVALQPLTILVGRNGAGKSNFLDALAFLRDAIRWGPLEAVDKRGHLGDIMCRSTIEREVSIEVEVGYHSRHRYDEQQEVQQAHYRVTLRPSVQKSRPPEVHERLLVTGPTWVTGFTAQNGIADWDGDFSEEEESRSTYPPAQLCLSGLGEQLFFDLAEGLRNMGFYNFNPHVIRRPQHSPPGLILQRDGSNLASVIDSLKEIDPETLQRVRDYLSLVTEEVDDFDTVHYEGDYETIRFRLRQGPGEHPLAFNASNMSDGTLRALASLMAAFQIHHRIRPRVVGIEEPETALHPAAMRALVDALDEATQRTQVLLTTHSADLLSGRDVTPGQVLVVRNRDRMTQITPVDPASREIITRELYSLADLQRMDKLDLDEADLKRQARLANGAGG